VGRHPEVEHSMSPLPTVNRQIVLRSRPAGVPSLENFEQVDGTVPEARDGQVLLQHRYLGLAPAARLRMGEADSYAKPLALGEVIYGQAVGTVIQSRHPDFQVGDTAVSIRGGWQEYSVASGPGLNKVDASIAPPTVWLGALGTSGMTAYVGLLDLGQPKAGETIVVSAASGAVGSAVGQIARILGCRVVGIAGGPAKCEFAVSEMQFDACVDYRTPDFAQRLAQACPAGIDVCFENVGGVSRDAAWPLLNTRARIVLCGLISEYNGVARPGPGWFDVLTKRLCLRGFIMSDHLDRRAAFERDMGSWYAQGRVHVREDVSQGLAQTPAAFIGMLEGRNLGKTIVQL
jgi:NADPH-dependent curcumin reductase CurA